MSPTSLHSGVIISIVFFFIKNNIIIIFFVHLRHCYRRQYQIIKKNIESITTENQFPNKVDRNILNVLFVQHDSACPYRH